MTTTKTKTIREVLNKAEPNEISDALRKVRLGNMVEPIKVTFASLSAAAAIDITTAASKAAATIAGGFTLASGETLPPIGQVVSLRVTAGAAAAGARVVTDAGGTAGAPGANGPGIALISDNGKTLTFEGNVTGFVLTYLPRSYTDVDTAFTA